MTKSQQGLQFHAGPGGEEHVEGPRFILSVGPGGKRVGCDPGNLVKHNPCGARLSSLSRGTLELTVAIDAFGRFMGVPRQH